MDVTPALIDRLATLARLRFSEEEKTALQQDLQHMIAFVDQLQEVDTTGIQPLIHISGESTLREDTFVPTLTREEALSPARHHNGQFFKVPKVIDKK
jgi:aspartyl-tRNA(Asn)/glutamyl-tRNA(Gln) amidotransferase subunit C